MPSAGEEVWNSLLDGLLITDYQEGGGFILNFLVNLNPQRFNLNSHVLAYQW
uniref:Uncharacterized protein n=1 Tax=Anguilla anguilla TaxID=7936 RepID=A0A0E9UNZ5_ANGAN